jgi:hypothetical protein
VWDPDEDFWNQGFRQLQKYKDEYGDCLPIATFKTTDDFCLGPWVRTQRNSYKNGNLTQERIKLLESLGFIWALR